jgi:hypothetical protein
MAVTDMAITFHVDHNAAIRQPRELTDFGYIEPTVTPSFTRLVYWALTTLTFDQSQSGQSGQWAAIRSGETIRSSRCKF